VPPEAPASLPARPPAPTASPASTDAAVPREVRQAAPPSSGGAGVEPSPIYTRWWFWTAIGVVGVAAVTTAVLLSSDTTRPACPSPATCE
jgi:hypothetical protein